MFRKIRRKKYSSVLISSNSQTNGRGRNQNKWHSKEGNIYFSLGFIKDDLSEKIPLKTAVIVSDAIKDFFGIDIQLKWPNDLAYKNKKIGGILVESINSDGKFFVVIGVGINLKLDALETHWGDLNLTINEKERLKFIKFVLRGYQKLMRIIFLATGKKGGRKNASI